MFKQTMSIVVVAGLVCVMTGSALAAPVVWSGAGGNDLWTNGANWFGGSAPGSGDTARFDNTATGGRTVNIGAATITNKVELVTGATGYDFIGAGQLNGQLDINTSGTNTFSCETRPTNNLGIRGTGTTNIDALFDRQDTIYWGYDTGCTVNVRSSGELAFNRLRAQGGQSILNVEAGGGLITDRYILHLDTTSPDILNVAGTVQAYGSSGSDYGIRMQNDGNRVVIEDGGLVYGYLTLHDDGDGSDSTVDMEPGAKLALRGGLASVDTLAEFYALTKGNQGLDGNHFRYGSDATSWTDFSSMSGSDWYALTYESNFMGTGQGYSVLQTLATSTAIPEPATMCALALAVAGLGGYVRKRRQG